MSLSSSESKWSFESENSGAVDKNLRADSGDEDTLVVNEPFANAAEENFVSFEDDADGLDPRTLEARFERTVQLNVW